MELDVKGKLNLTERIALKLAYKINEQMKTDSLSFKKIKYGLEVLLINLFKMGSILIVAMLFGIAKNTFIIMIVFFLVRRYAYGIHAKSSINCTLITAAIYFAGAWIGKNFYISSRQSLIMAAIAIGLLYCYAPADTEARPLVGKKLRKRLKIKALVTVLAIMIVTWGLNIAFIQFLAAYAVLCEAVTTIPVVYKLFGRGYKNYEKYKKVSG